MPGQRRPAAAGEQPEPVVEAGGDLLDRSASAAGRRPARSPAASRPAAGRSPPRPTSRRRAKPGRTAAARSASSRTAGMASACAAPRRGGRPSGATGHSASPVMPSGSRLVARMRSRGQRPAGRRPRRAAASTRCSQLSRTSSARRSASEDLDQPAAWRRAAGRRRRLDGAARPASERAEHGLRDLGGVGDRGQLDQPGRRRGPVGADGLVGQPGLARAAGADQRDQPARPAAACRAGSISSSRRRSWSAGPAGSDRARRAAAARGVRVGAEHRAGGSAAARATGRRRAPRRACAGSPRTRPAPRPAARGVQRAHQQAAQPLAQRMRPRAARSSATSSAWRPSRSSASTRSSAAAEPASRPAGRRAASANGRPAASASAGPAPQRERLAQQPRALAGIAAGSARRPSSRQPLEPVRVDGVAASTIEPVARRARTQHRRVRQRPAQPGHQGLQRVGARRRAAVRPRASATSASHGDDPPRLQREPGEQRPQPRATDLDGLAAGRHLQRPQDVHVHTSTVPPTAHETLICMRRGWTRTPTTPPAASLTFWTVPHHRRSRPSHLHEGTAALYADAGSWQAPIRTRRSRRPGSISASCSTPRRAHVRAGRGVTS